MSDLFKSSHVKLQRANRFIAEVQAGLDAYNADAPISAEFDYTSGAAGLKISWKQIDPDVLAALGDAIHNMRAALDLLACELVRANGRSDHGVYFPFSASKDDFPHAIKHKNFHRAGDDAVALLNAFAPYKGGNDRLRAIHDLDIQDKHTGILVTQHVTEGLQLQYELDQGPNPAIHIAAGSIRHNFLAPPLEGLPLIATLRELVGLVNEIISSFTELIGQRSSGEAS